MKMKIMKSKNAHPLNEFQAGGKKVQVKFYVTVNGEYGPDGSLVARLDENYKLSPEEIEEIKWLISSIV